MMGHMLDRVRGDFRILANSVFRRAEELNRVILPISFDETKEAVRLNIETRADLRCDYLAQGGAIGVFPGGTVSTAAKPFSQPMDPGWRNFTAKMIAKSDATVVPDLLRRPQLPPVPARLATSTPTCAWPAHQGVPLPHRRTRAHRRRQAAARAPSLPPCGPTRARMMEYPAPRHLCPFPEPLKSYDYGYEFEDKYRAQ